MNVTIVTGDRDALQLVSDTVRVAIPHKGYQQAEYLGPQEVEAKYGIRPDQVVSYKGLSGDSSDNLAGVRGIGPKTASILLQQYGDLDGIYSHLSEIKPAWREKLETDREQAYFCARMAELVCDIPLPVSLDDVALAELPTSAIASLFTEMEFTVLQKRLLAIATSSFGESVFDTPIDVDSSGAQDSQLALFSVE